MSNTDMPEEIWAGMLSSGEAYWASHKIGSIYDVKYTKGKDPTKYARTDTIRKALQDSVPEVDVEALKKTFGHNPRWGEGMNSAKRSNIQGWNACIDHLIKRGILQGRE